MGLKKFSAGRIVRDREHNLYTVVAIDGHLLTVKDAEGKKSVITGSNLTRVNLWGDADIGGPKVAYQADAQDKLEDYVRQRIVKAAKSTVMKEINFVARLMRHHGLLIEKPKVKRGRFNGNRPFTSDELIVFFNHFSPEQRILFEVMLSTGARPCELIPSKHSNHKALLKADIEPEQGIINLRCAKLKPGEVPKVRLIRIPDDLMERVVAAGQQHTGPYEFDRRNRSLKNTFDRILLRAGLATRAKAADGKKLGQILKTDVLDRKLTGHSFRHIRHLDGRADGAQCLYVKNAMGHSQITTTQQYCKPAAPEIVIDPKKWSKGVPAGCPAECEIEAKVCKLYVSNGG